MIEKEMRIDLKDLTRMTIGCRGDPKTGEACGAEATIDLTKVKSDRLGELKCPSCGEPFSKGPIKPSSLQAFKKAYDDLLGETVYFRFSTTTKSS